MPSSELVLEPVTSAIGVEIHGIDLSENADERIYSEIRAALSQHAVVFFRNQNLTTEQFVAFGERFGEVFVNSSSIIRPVDGCPKVEEIRKEPHEHTNVGDQWHTDQAHRSSPCMGTILMARTVPAHGGDTLFINMAKAYEALSEGLKHTLEGLRAVHSHAFLIANAEDPDGRFTKSNAKDETIHPVVKVLPETGRNALYVSPGYTVRFDGWTRKESTPLLEYLYGHAQRPEFCCRFRWAEGSIAFWDNRQTWHYATNDYHGHRRVMHRMVIK
jgi:taurine dioxygenase